MSGCSAGAARAPAITREDTTATRNVSLIERRADARQLAETIKEHERDCPHCASTEIRGKCGRQKEMAAALKGISEEIAHWFDPPADAETLF